MLTPLRSLLDFSSDGLWEYLYDEAAVENVYKNPRAGIAKKLIGVALKEAAKKREMRYKDITKIEKRVKRHFHDDISVNLDSHKNKNKSSKKSHGPVGCISAPIDIYSYNSDIKMQ